ncbi:MAG: GxxExxY protein, partial [Gammaproteobacteria bacterium]|nr:GxxExxY protein [Gammaproteobacteria bacterium]
MNEDEISKVIVDAAVEVHRTVGPGLLESVYQKCLVRELGIRGVPCQEEVPLAVHYKGLSFESAFRLDVLVAEKVIVELKVVENVLPVHKAQLLSYLRLSRLRLGLLINFNVPLLKGGITQDCQQA